MLPPPEGKTMALATYNLRVHGYHCDLYGHVNNARYLEFLESARWELLAAAIDLGDWHDRGRRFVIVRIDISYRAVATLRDDLRVESRGGEVGRSSAKIEQRVIRAADEQLIAEAMITYVILDAETGRPLRLSGELRDTISRLGQDGPPE